MKRVITLVILNFTLIVSCLAQKSKMVCDFSAYKPLVISHALLKAAVEKVEPQYPPAARAVMAEGGILVKILVNRSGHVIDACASKGHPLLRAAAVKAARRWRFKRNFGFSEKSKLIRRHRFIVSEIWFNFKST